jgi:hypothetical protein
MNNYTNTEYETYRVWNETCLCCGTKLTFKERRISK